MHDPDGVRLQKVLAAAGLGLAPRVRGRSSPRVASTVDGQAVLELGVRVDPLTAVVHVDGMRVQLDSSHRHDRAEQAEGVVSTMHDPEGRPSLAQYVADREERLFHVGRLDADTEGLLLLTNDGELANRLAHPSHGVPKTYLVEVQGRVTARRSAAPADRASSSRTDRSRSTSSPIVQASPHVSLVEVALHEGRNRIVRRMLEEVGHPVTSSCGTRIGPIRLGDLKPGRTRVLSQTRSAR